MRVTDRQYLTWVLLVALLMIALGCFSTPFRQKPAPDAGTDFRQVYTR